ncbi:MAG TPA: MFS transporter [Actinomycetales bacterium]|nr:MFS transporter [Actinomycetales bacterium]
MLSGAAGTGYRQVLGTSAAVRPFAAAVVARLPISMAPLGALLLVQHVHGSYGFAGTVTGAFALGTAVGGPVWARLMGRWGQSAIVAGTSLLSGLLLAALALVTVEGGSAWLLLVLSASSGLTFPPVGPAMRAAWAVIFPPGRVRDAGYALDAVAVESIFVGGPLLLSVMLVLPPAVPLLVTALLLAAGGVAYSLTGAARHGAHRVALSHDGTSSPGAGVLRRPSLVAVFASVGAMAIGFGHLDTAMAATAREVLSNQRLLGLLFMAIAGGSAIGGLVYGARHWPGNRSLQIVLLLAVFTAGLSALPFVVTREDVGLELLMPFLFVAGLAIAPTMIIQMHLVDALAGPRQASVGQALLSSAGTTGSAAGTALGGIVIDAHGPSWGFGGAVIAAALALLVVLSARRRWAPVG